MVTRKSWWLHSKAAKNFIVRTPSLGRDKRLSPSQWILEKKKIDICRLSLLHSKPALRSSSAEGRLLLLQNTIKPLRKHSVYPATPRDWLVNLGSQGSVCPTTSAKSCCAPNSLYYAIMAGTPESSVLQSNSPFPAP